MAIEISENKLQAIISATPVAIAVFTGRDLIIKNPNQAFIEILGKNPDIVGLPLHQAMPELISEGQPFLNILDEVYTTGVPFISHASLVRIEMNGVLRDKYFDISYIPLLNSNKEVYAILDVAIDVTEQVLAQQKIAESEARFRSIADQSPIIIFIIEPNENATISYWSKSWLDYTGQSREQALGRAWDGIVHPDDIRTVLDIYIFLRLKIDNPIQYRQFD